MRRRINFKFKHIVVTVTCVCIGAIAFSSRFGGKDNVINNTFSFVIQPVQSAFTTVENWFDSTIDNISNLNKLEEENLLLKLKIEKLEQENALLRKDQADLNRFRDLFKLHNEYENYNMVGAKIIAKTPGNWYSSFTINKGTSAGIEKDMVVMAVGGLVGHVRSVSKNYAIVQAIIDDTSSVHAEDVRTGDRMFVEGDKRLNQQGLCKVTFIDTAAEVIEGDELVTSALGNVYPPELSIGVITKIEDNPHNLIKTAYLKTNVDFTKLSEVLIITDKWKADLATEQAQLNN